MLACIVSLYLWWVWYGFSYWALMVFLAINMKDLSEWWISHISIAKKIHKRYVFIKKNERWFLYYSSMFEVYHTLHAFVCWMCNLVAFDFLCIYINWHSDHSWRQLLERLFYVIKKERRPTLNLNFLLELLIYLRDMISWWI